MFDINWSFDGTLIAAGIENNIVLLDMAKLLSEPDQSNIGFEKA